MLVEESAQTLVVLHLNSKRVMINFKFDQRHVIKERLKLWVLILTCILSLTSFELFGQDAAADKMIIEIDSFKKYETTKTDNKEDLKSLGDSTIEITEVINYMRKNRNNLSGKVTENSKTSAGEIKRTYYFNEQSKLFAIVDQIKDRDNTRKKLTYYFGGGQLTRVIDDAKNDVTNTINKQHLYYWIIKMFGHHTIVE
jgi:hypothetical protein